MEITRLRALTEAAVAINSTLSIDAVLQLITNNARVIIGAHQSVTSATLDKTWAQAINHASLSEKYAQWANYQAPPNGSGIYALVCKSNQPMRLTQPELEAHPAWQHFGDAASEHPPMRGWLAAPLVAPDGHNLGVIQLSDKYEGEFSEEDEIILVQFAQLASIAIENSRLYQEQVAARQEAEEANQLKLEFLALITHELRTPLASIKGFATTLISEDVTFGAATQREFLMIINQESDRVNELVGRLIDLSQLHAGLLRMHRGAYTVNEMIETARPQLDTLTSSHLLYLDIPDNLPRVMADKRRTSQVLINLVSNAVKYTPANTHITLRATAYPEHVQFDVRDEGPGIPSEYHNVVFEAFRQLEDGAGRFRKGAGIGLAISKGIIEAQNGSIWIEKDVPGTTISFTLPLAPSA